MKFNDVMIKHIDQVLPYIDGYKEFIHVIKDGYQVIDYVFVSNDIFKNPFEDDIDIAERHKRLIQLQCRGIKFDLDGNIIGRPFHKFKNYGEDGHIKNIYDWSKPHRVMTKLDGSMVHSCIINGRLRLCTRMGITDQSLEAEQYLTDHQRIQLEVLNTLGANAILEYTSPSNRIVIAYDEPKLTLLAIRNIYTGHYHRNYAIERAFPVVEEHPEMVLGDQNIEQIRAETTGIEGYVVSWADGTYVKIKSNEYTQMHRAVSFFEREDMILPAVLDSQCDDLYPNLSLDRAERLFEYEAQVMKEFLGLVDEVYDARYMYIEDKFPTRKDYAMWVNSNVSTGLRAAYFAAIDNKNVEEAVKACILRNPDLLSVRW